MRNHLEQLVSYLKAYDFIERDPGTYLNQMLNDASVELAKTGSDYSAGFKAGMAEAANTLRAAANEHDVEAASSKKVLESQAHQLAAALFRSWANGIDINSDKVW